MYYPYFITYMLIGMVIGFLVFFWALNNGQFRDQDRARFLPLQDELDKSSHHRSRVSRLEVYALVLLATTGLLVCAAVLVFAMVVAR